MGLNTYVCTFILSVGMARRRVRVEFEDGEGGKYTLALTGAFTKNKAMRLIEIVELLGDRAPSPEETVASTETTFGRLYQLVDKRFPLGSFTSTDLLEAYEDEYQKPIKLSTISTYLCRFAERGALRRERIASGWSYRRARVNLPTGQ